MKAGTNLFIYIKLQQFKQLMQLALLPEMAIPEVHTHTHKYRHEYMLMIYCVNIIY